MRSRASDEHLSADERSAVAALSKLAEPLPPLDAPDFAAFADRLADAKVVLLGEASHGTSEFYRARAAITKRLIERHGFRIVAVEADWPDAAAIDRYVRWKPHRPDEEAPFQRFPVWMWRNVEVDQFIRWLRDRNEAAPSVRAGFFGLDLYSLDTSIRAVIDYLDAVDPATANVARERYACLRPWAGAHVDYGRAALERGFAPCEEAVVGMLQSLLAKRLDYCAQDGEAFFDAAQNARLVRDAEVYYRAMYYGSAQSWNLRDRHMFETLEALVGEERLGGKAIVWAHNSHIGDARETGMSERGEHNLGQLCRERWGDGALLVGFGTDRGTVAATTDWGDDMEIKQVRPALPSSYEAIARATGIPRYLVDFRRADASRRAPLSERRLERFIGVIYRPETERWSHYVESALARQFDVYLWFDETAAISPLATHSEGGEPDTYPFGL